MEDLAGELRNVEKCRNILEEEWKGKKEKQFIKTGSLEFLFSVYIQPHLIFSIAWKNSPSIADYPFRF